MKHLTKLGLLLVLGIACKDASTHAPVPSRRLTLQVTGTVRDAAGNSVLASRVIVTAVSTEVSVPTMFGDCRGGLMSSDTTFSGKDGSFSRLLESGGPAPLTCLSITATSPSGMQLNPATLTVNGVRFTRVPAGGGVPDTVTVQIVLGLSN
jgi:hypothetical protein